MSVTGALKKTTGLTGLAVSPNSQRVLTVLYNKILKTIQKMPSESGYRKNTEAIIMARADIVKNSKAPSEIEEKVDCGQVEELIVQAENELSLARNMLVWKPWEPLLTQAPENQWKWPPAN